MERLLVTTANFPKHGQPGETSGEDSVKTPWTWDQNEASIAGKRLDEKGEFPPARVGWDRQARRVRYSNEKSERGDGHLRGYR